MMRSALLLAVLAGSDATDSTATATASIVHAAEIRALPDGGLSIVSPVAAQRLGDGLMVFE